MSLENELLQRTASVEDSAGNTVKMVRIGDLKSFSMRAGFSFPDEHENGRHWSRANGRLSRITRDECELICDGEFSRAWAGFTGSVQV